MQFPDIDATALTLDEQRIWLTALFDAMGDQAEGLVMRLPDEVVESVLYYLYNVLNDAEANPNSLGVDWRKFLRLD